MTLTELVIVYTSCGAPFAVERLLSDDRPNRAPNALASVVHLCFWPAFLLVKLVRVIKTVFVSQKDQKNPEIVDGSDVETGVVYQDLVNLLAGPSSDRSVLSIKELLERYVGLASLLKQSKREPLIHDSEIARVSKHPSPILAAACRNRRNIALVGKHLASARSEFLDLLSDGLLNSSGGDSRVSSVLNFVEHLDPAAVEQIQQIIAIHDSSIVVNTMPAGRVHLEESSAAL